LNSFACSSSASAACLKIKFFIFKKLSSGKIKIYAHIEKNSYFLEAIFKESSFLLYDKHLQYSGPIVLQGFLNFARDYIEYEKLFFLKKKIK
jgi:hypothetical protein